jgi:ankyrin repeat protein
MFARMSSSGSDSDCSDFDWEGFNDCVRSNCLKEVEEFIEDPRFNVDDADDDFTALLLAINEGHFEMVKLLLKAGYCVHEMSREGETPLGEAIRCQDLDMIKLLVEHGADIENGNGTPGVIMAASERDLEMVKYFVEKGADADSVREACYQAAKSKSRDTAVLEYLFSVAVKRPSNKIVIEMARNGAKSGLEFILKQQDYNVNYENKRKETPLYVAVQNGHAESIKLLLDNKATITADIVFESFQQKKADISKCIFEADRNGSSLIDSLAARTDKEGNTIVHLLIRQNHEYDFVSKVVHKFKNLLDTQNVAGQTPLVVACKYNVSMPVFTYLLNRSRPGVKDNKGNTAIMYAAKNGRLDMVTALCKKKVSVKRLKNVKGKTLLHKSVRSQNFELVKFLDEQGLLGDVNAKDTKQRTVLMFNKSSVSITQLLTEKGADLKYQDDAGNTLLHNMIKQINTKNADEYIQFIAYIVNTCDELKEFKNTAGKIPLQIAKRHYNSGKLYRILS